MRILYIFSGNRSDRFTGEAGIDYPDTQFYGMNHLATFGMQAEYKEFESFWFGKFVARVIGFRIKHLFMYFVARKYDVVFGISVLYMLFWKKFIPTKTKFVIFNSVLNRMFQVHKKGSLKYRALIWLLKDADGIVFFNKSDRDIVVAHAPFMENKSYVVSMGVDMTYHKPIFADREDYYLSVGRDNGRDYRTVIEAARRSPEQKFHLVCLPRNIAGLDIPSNVTVHHDIPLAKLQDLYKKARALLLILHDGSNIEGSQSSGPTVLLEAMARGLPVVVSRKEYVREYGEDGKDMLTVDFYDVDAIIGCINQLGDEALRGSLAHSARNKIEMHFNTIEMAKHLSEVFKTVYGQ